MHGVLKQEPPEESTVVWIEVDGVTCKCLILPQEAFAQVPFFAGATGPNKLFISRTVPEEFWNPLVDLERRLFTFRELGYPRIDEIVDFALKLVSPVVRDRYTGFLRKYYDALIDFYAFHGGDKNFVDQLRAIRGHLC